MKYSDGVPPTDLQDYSKQIEANLQAFEQVLQNMSPDLYTIYVVMKETGVQPRVISELAIQLGKLLANDNAYGKVWVDVLAGKVKFVKSRNDVMIADFDE